MAKKSKKSKKDLLRPKKKREVPKKILVRPKKIKKKQLGRPPSGGPGTPVQVRLQSRLLDAIDRAIAADGRGISRPTAIRDLVADALASLGMLPVAKSDTHHQP